MRVQSIQVLFGGILASVGTLGASPCYGCPDVPAHTESESVDCNTAQQLLEAVNGFSIAAAWPDAAASVIVEGDADVQSNYADDAGEHAGNRSIALPARSCGSLCSSGTASVTGCRLSAGPVDGGVPYSPYNCSFDVDCDYASSLGRCGGGRATAGVRLGSSPRTSPLADYFAACAGLEGASVRSFRRLRIELARHGAPRWLRRACSRAARDELRHARAMGALARRYGARRTLHFEEAQAPRSLLAIAIENAREGCIFETFGALLAAWQAVSARQPIVRDVVRRLARDEARHGCLAWGMATWLEARLDRAARARVRVERQHAAAELVESLGAVPDATLVAEGLQPTRTVRVAMARALVERLV